MALNMVGSQRTNPRVGFTGLLYSQGQYSIYSLDEVFSVEDNRYMLIHYR